MKLNNPLLYRLSEKIPLLGSAPVSSEYKEGEFVFEQGTEQFDKGNYTEASQKFMKAAKLWIHSPDPFYHGQVLENRLLAYKNATWSLLNAKSPATCKEQLLNAMKEDADCSKELEKIIAHYLNEAS